MILLCLVLAIATLWIGGRYIRDRKRVVTLPGSARHQAFMPDVSHRGVWEWKDVSELPGVQIESDMELLQEHHFTTLYLNVGSYIDIYEQADKQKRDRELQFFEEKLRATVARATQRGITVHALAGDTRWGFASHAYIPNRFIEFVHLYNTRAKPEEKLEGLQFDIEVYNDKQFNANKKQSLQEYYQTVASNVQTYRQLRATFMLGYALPYWYDNENGNIPEITVNKKSAPVAYHLFDLLSQLDNGYVVIMDYRDTVEGSDGSVAHAQNEIIYASKYAKKVKIVIAQETTDVEPAKITFFNQPRANLHTALLRLAKSFETYGSFYGIAVHDLAGYKNLKE